MSGLILRDSAGIRAHAHTKRFCQHSDADGNDSAEEEDEDR